MRDCRLKSIEAVIQRQQRMPAKGDDDGLILKRQAGRFWLFQADGCAEIHRPRAERVECSAQTVEQTVRRRGYSSGFCRMMTLVPTGTRS